MSGCSGNCSSCGESCSDRKQESLLAEPNKNSQVKKVIAVVSGVGLIITKVISGFKLLKAGFLLAKGALTPLISSVWSFTAALLANPVTWIVIGIVALIAALVLLAAVFACYQTVVLNIAVVTNTIPNTGISLPFVSYGGTSILFLLSEMGLALSVSRGIKFEVT